MKLSFVSKLAAAVIAAGFLSGCFCAKTECQHKDSKTQFAAEAVKPYIESGELPGIISIFCKGNLQETVCAGWADVDQKRPITMDNLFMQCSQTKGFCGVTIAILVEEGKISLDDPVSKYLPEFKNLKVRAGKNKVVPAKNTLTIRMVMNHTGGFGFEIPTKSKKGWPGLSLRDTAKEAASIPLYFEPGTKARYSNTGIDIGAAVVEVVTGKPWEIFLKERVLDPLGMENSTFNPTDEQLKNSISMYMVKKGKKAEFLKFNSAMPLPHNGPNVHPSAGAGLWTTAADQLKFYKMLMNLGVGENGVRILKEETVKKYLADSTRPKNLGTYSLGLNVDLKNGIMGHGGAWGTSCSVNWKKKELRLKVVQLNGGPRPWDKKIGEAANKFFSMKVDDSATEAYTGRMK
ncbi:MAG: beta-lactamase family protein [Lentisphaeria bacterium]|nr:beta-lactamase family protein [Lentisphaeria bacterium]